MAIIMKKIALLKLWAEMLDASRAPKEEPVKAGNTIAIKSFGSVLIDFRYLRAAVEVPKKAAVLEVPTTDTGLLFGNAKSIAGV